MNQHDPEKINRALLTLFLTIATIVGSFMVLKLKHPALFFLIPAIPLGVYLFSNPSKLYVALMLGTYARLNIPGLPSSLSFTVVLSVAIIACVFFVNAMKKNLKAIPEKSDFFLWGFIVVVLLTMSVRGFSMRLMGGSEYGGSHYIKLLAILLVYPVASRIILGQKDVKIIAWGRVIASAIPFCLALAMVLSGGKLWFLQNFADMNTGYLIEGVMGDMANVRWEQFAFMASGLQVLALAYPFKTKAPRVLIMAIAFALVMRSGFRGNFFALGVLTGLWLIYIQKTFKKRVQMVVILGLCGLLAWGLVVLGSPYFPRQMQRAVSFVPGAKVPEDIARSAMDSSLFRVEIWKYALKHLSRYFLVGRGMMLDVTGVAWLRASFYSQPEFFYLAHNYHSGPIHMLMDFGIFGLCAGIGFFVSTCVEAWRGLKAVNQYCQDAFVRNFYAFNCIVLTWGVFSYFFMYGDMGKILTNYILMALLLRLLRKRYQLQAQSECLKASYRMGRIGA